MPLRLVEIRLRAQDHVEAAALAESHDRIDSWSVRTGDDEVHEHIMEADKVEGFVDAIRARFGDDVRVVILPVEATLPRSETAEVAAPVAVAEPPKPKGRNRVSREELYEDIGERIRLDPVFLTLATASAVVACIGLATDDTVALIGAMVIAPLLGPNVGLALATTLGDLDLGRKALKSGVAGIGLSFLIAFAYGSFLDVPDSPAIADRVAPSMFSVALALASGVAGGLAFTSGVPASLIGVMVAVALLPPLATGGMLLGDGQVDRSSGAFLLLGVNLVAVNLAGVATFLTQGIRPVWSSEKEKARRAARNAIILWSMLLAALIAGVAVIRQ